MLGGDNVCHCGACDRHMIAELVESLISVRAIVSPHVHGEAYVIIHTNQSLY